MIIATALAIMLRMAWTLSGGVHRATFDAASLPEHLVLILGCLCALRFAFNAMQHLSLDLIIVALLMYGAVAATGRRYLRTAICWGLAAAFKGPPLLFAGYLLWRRKWIPALLMVAVALAANLLPDLVHRPAGEPLWLTRWYHQFIQPLGAAKYVPGEWNADILDNQSIAGAANRWLLTSFSASRDGITVTENPNAISAHSLKLLVYSIDGLLCLLVGLIMLPGRPPTAAPADQHFSGRLALECGVVMLLMLLLSPMSSRSLFCAMILPAFCVARAALLGRDRISQVALFLAIAGTLVSINMSFDRTLNREMLWLGTVTMSCLVLLLASLWLLVRHRFFRVADDRLNSGFHYPVPL
jgi:hypothetical protein